MAINQKGQASITDAIMFLLLCSALATILFYFTAGYGYDQERQIQTRYMQSYTSSVYKALLWSPVVRPGGVSDYLLAYSKETYSGGITDLKAVAGYAENLYTLNESINNNHEWLFAIYPSEDIDTPDLLIYKRGNDEVYVCETNPKLRDFVDEVTGGYSTEGILTFENQVKKSVMLVWPLGTNDTPICDDKGSGEESANQKCNLTYNDNLERYACSLSST